MIEGVIFDLFNTLVFETREKPRFVEFSQMINKNSQDYNYMKVFEKHFMTSVVPDFKIPIPEMLTELRIPFDEALVDRLAAVLMDFTPESFKFFEDVRPALATLKGKFRLGILSNCTALVYSVVRQRFKLEDNFDAVVTSFQLGRLKPDKAAFLAAMNSLGLNRDQVIFVGDSFKDDVRAAENLGLNSVMIDRQKKNPAYTNRIEALTELGRFLR